MLKQTILKWHFSLKQINNWVYKMQNREAKSEQVKTFLVSGAYRLLVTSLKKIIYCTGNRKTEPKCFQGSFCQ